MRKLRQPGEALTHSSGNMVKAICVIIYIAASWTTRPLIKCEEVREEKRACVTESNVAI